MKSRIPTSIASIVLALAPFAGKAQIEEVMIGPDSKTYFHAEITLDSVEGVVLPFEILMISHAENKEKNPPIDLYIQNGAELLLLKYKGLDSTGYEIWELPYFSGYFRWIMEGTGIRGQWIRPDVNQSFPMHVITGKQPRFNFSTKSAIDGSPLATRYDLRMYNDNPDEVSPYVAVFNEDENGEVRGTIMTNSGDFRYLVGNRKGNKLSLSTFNGVFAYLFEFEIQPNGQLHGTYYSGATTRKKLRATPDTTVELLDPTAIATWDPEAGPLKLNVSDYRDGNPLSLDSGFVYVVQIMGSWCPNCVDESDAFRRMLSRFSEQPLRVVAVTFERWEELHKAYPAIDKFVQDLSLPYPVGFGGRANAESIQRVFPGLQNFRAYPTTLYVDKRGHVRKVYTGFNGPGTPVYNDWLEETQRYLVELMNE